MEVFDDFDWYRNIENILVEKEKWRGVDGSMKKDIKGFFLVFKCGKYGDQKLLKDILK